MSTITYTAQREIPKTGYQVGALNAISAQASDNSFNSTDTGVLIDGLTAGQWLKVTGFDNDDNNGWFLVAQDATAYKILTPDAADTGGLGRDLIDEAGANILLVGYIRGAGQQYSLEFYSERVERSVKVKRTDQQPMGGGAPEVLLQRREVFYDVMVLGPNGELLTEEMMPQWREFLASVEGGESFTMDRYGSLASPDNPETVVMASTDYDEERVGSVRLYKIGFKVRVL